MEKKSAALCYFAWKMLNVSAQILFRYLLSFVAPSFPERRSNEG